MDIEKDNQKFNQSVLMSSFWRTTKVLLFFFFFFFYRTFSAAFFIFTSGNLLFSFQYFELPLSTNLFTLSCSFFFCLFLTLSRVLRLVIVSLPRLPTAIWKKKAVAVQWWSYACAKPPGYTKSHGCQCRRWPQRLYHRPVLKAELNNSLVYLDQNYCQERGFFNPQSHIVKTAKSQME